MGDEQTTSRLVAVCVLGLLLFSPPLLSLFDHDELVAGIPLLWMYLFLAWALVIGLVAAVIRRRE